MEDENLPVGVNADAVAVEEPTNAGAENTTDEFLSPLKPESEVTRTDEESPTTSNGGDSDTGDTPSDDAPSVEAPSGDTLSVSSAQKDHKNVDTNIVSNNETPTTTIESSPSSKPKSTTNIESSPVSKPKSTTTIESSPSYKPKSKGSKKKKKKKISRNDDDGNSPEFNEQSDDKFSNGLETTTVVSTTSSKLKSKGTKKKKKKMNADDDGENLDTASVSSNKSGNTSTNKSLPKKKKKKKKISRDGESVDGVPDSTRSLLTTSVKSATTSMKSTSKPKSKSGKSLKSPKSAKSKKKKVKNSNAPDIERTMSLELVQSTFVDLKKTNEQPNFIVKRSMSLDECNIHYRPQSSTSPGRMNSQREYRENGTNNNNWSGRGSAQHGSRGRGSPGRGRVRGRGRGSPGGLASNRPQRPPERTFSQERSPYGSRGVSKEGIPYRGSSHERTPYGARNGARDSSHERTYGARNGARDSSHERTYGARKGARDSSQERLPYGNARVINGRGSATSPRGRRRLSFPPPKTFDENPSSQSMSSKGIMYRAPGKPKSILRNSHHGMPSGSSHHRSVATSSSHSGHKRRVSMDLASGSKHSYKYDPHGSIASEIDSSDVESDDDDASASSFAMEYNHRSHDMEDSGKRYQKQVPKTVTKGFLRTLSGLGTNSSHHVSNFKASSHSMRSLMTIERPEFEGENKFISALRYIHILAPHANEDPIKKKIRIVTWVSLFMDFLNALVAIITYGGETTQCCKQSILSAFGGDKDYNWEITILIVTSLYMFLIFLEVVPVMRDAFPFNLLNPFIGFLITFAVFFSDSITEAAIMWVVEMLAVVCEAIIYRLRKQKFANHKVQLKNTKKEIEKLRKIKRRVKNQFDNGGGRILTRGDSAAQFAIEFNDSSSFAEDSSFFDDVETQHNSVDAHTVASRTALTSVSNIGTARETRLLRDRRQLIHSQAEDERDLRIHFFGVSVNIFLVGFSLVMIITIAKNGGMCIEGLRFGNIFANNQLEKCFKCDGEEVCEKCVWSDAAETIATEESQCYYPYGIRT